MRCAGEATRGNVIPSGPGIRKSLMYKEPATSTSGGRIERHRIKYGWRRCLSLFSREATQSAVWK